MWQITHLFSFNKSAKISSERSRNHKNTQSKLAIQMLAHTQEQGQKFFALIAFIIQINVSNFKLSEI